MKIIFILSVTCLLLEVCLARGGRRRGSKSEANATETQSSRTGRLFSLFNVVSFQNDMCNTDSAVSGGSTSQRTGTCFTVGECEARGGRPSGTCASGFGVCCLFTTTECGTTITNNNTYVRNPGFPDEVDDPSDCTYQVERVEEGICQLRLDFETFVIAGPPLVPDSDLESEDIHEVNGGECVTDSFTVTGLKTGFRVPEICGDNKGQHMYIDVGNDGKSAATLAFNFNGNSRTDKEWEIKVAQIPCRSEYKAPNDCLQFLTGTMGKLKTFNFDDPVTSHLANQNYNICIRQEAGHCCIKYSVCEDEELAFSLDTVDEEAKTDIDCTQDYLQIQSNGPICQSFPQVSLNKFCGLTFSATADTNVEENGIVCSCSAPFMVGVKTNEVADDEDPDGTNDVNSRGACLDYRQVPC
ncbi:uncharacterized protein LOC131884036 [Tigriopus californicus]|uniref:uncharacterized protein LOC131884036 n=1 Tax=Tigriopus californicus TaxID=6832 RepID=UPI0027D9EA09|nr:uncharacterized protein LOC131884036 [Tigriopus californicus]